MSNATLIHILEGAGIRPTANRLLVLRTLQDSDSPLSLVEIESILETLEKSSIFRVLTLLLEKNVLHTVEDGRGIVKYELCRGNCQHTVEDMHAHFYCESCHKVFCFENQHVQRPDIPSDYVVKSVNYMLKGLCPDCAHHSGKDS